jgi:hypothetical protein
VSKGNTTETDLLGLIFTATALSWAAATELDIHLHTADPGEGGNSTTNECTYTGYAAVTVNRSATDWTVTGNTVVNDNLIQFPQCSAGTNTATHVSITPEGSTQILVSGALASSLSISAGIQPQIAAGDLSITED